MSDRVAVVGGARTPIGKAGRAYRDVHPVDLFRHALHGMVETTGVDPAQVDRVLAGCTHQMGDQAINVGRNAWLAAGYPELVPALTLDAQCCSGQEVANLGYALIASGQADLVVVGGVESLSRVESGSTSAPELGNPYPPSLRKHWSMPHQSEAAERMATKYGITREAADAYGVASHLRAAAAWDSDAFAGEIAFVPGMDGPLLRTDEGIRPDSTPERSARLAPAHTVNGIVTAANASQLSDGAAAVLLASEQACARLGLRPRAWFVQTASTGADPDLMLEGPIHATHSVLKRAGLTIDDVSAVEIHEAYAIPVLAWMDRFGVSHDRVNVDGGAIGVGHPFGASGVRQLLHLTHLLERAAPGSVGLQTMCGGGGLGVATLLRNTA